ncbi:uncharacterized protein LOC126284635 [Schistocerca gregaria]|uniref:uncharacterized protein LOC126284635 n=1 Tax=Schistocerca gregaria TaxID=7010 RepID=UPI00211E6712|nr:uncharacterized protein LOC126284635 [Schistocerca gregaria]
MAPSCRAVALLHVACLLAAARFAACSDTVLLRPRGWPQAECELSTEHGASGGQQGDDSRADFWMRGWLSRQFYRCRLDATDDVRAGLFAASQGGLLPLTARWTINLNKFRRSHWPDNYRLMSATRTPQFDCLAGETPLPGPLFPLTARRPGTQWHKCFPVPDKHHGDRFVTSDGLVTISFHGGAPTVVCGVSREVQPTSLPLRAILPLPYSCFFATYLDFPSLSDPPASDVFQKLVADKWVCPFSGTFPPFQCWPAADDPSRPFDFDVLFDGKHAHRCLFQTLCGEGQVSTVASVSDYSSGDMEVTKSDSFPSTLHTNLDSLLVSKLNFRPTGADGMPDEVTMPSFSENDITGF